LTVHRAVERIGSHDVRRQTVRRKSTTVSQRARTARPTAHRFEAFNVSMIGVSRGLSAGHLQTLDSEPAASASELSVERRAVSAMTPSKRLRRAARA
jgi:hypothetical protein